MRIVLFDTETSPPMVKAGHLSAADPDVDPQCAVAILTADTTHPANPAKMLVIPANPGWLQIELPITEICASTITQTGLTTSFTPSIHDVWDMNCGFEGVLPATWPALGWLSVGLFKNGVLYRRLDRRRFSNAEPDWFIGGSCAVPVDGQSDVLSIRFQWSGATPIAITTWLGWADFHWAHQAACDSCET